ncbi:hypothetical protein HK405_000268 [Cladochytrium tenue]|nr:hypothetical protein HK405_000268 [Cladochytrium tenue]
MVVFRDDLLARMRRNAVACPDEEDESQAGRMLVKTIASQGHLSPLPVTSRPVFWEVDHALQVYPLPQLMVLADRDNRYTHTVDGKGGDEGGSRGDAASGACVALNPGSFGASGTFAMWAPATAEASIGKV